MLLLSFGGWMNGLSTIVVFFFATIFGLRIVFISNKEKLRILSILGLLIFLSGFFLLAAVADFFSILFFGRNMGESVYHFALTASISSVVVLMLSIYIGVEFLIPNKKNAILLFYGILEVITLTLMISSFPDFMKFAYPAESGENLVDLQSDINSPHVIFMLIIFASSFMLGVFGFLTKGIRSTGLIRRKFFHVSLGFFLNHLFSILDVFSSNVNLLVFFRAGLIIGLIFLYLGLKEEIEKQEKPKIIKDVKFEEDLFRISQIRREDITEEEVSISKEKKICLVCKGKVLGFNNFICPQCETFYCERCARTLVEMENACWACGSPIDDSKPVTPNEERDKSEDIDVIKK